MKLNVDYFFSPQNGLNAKMNIQKNPYSSFKNSLPSQVLRNKFRIPFLTPNVKGHFMY